MSAGTALVLIAGCGSAHTHHGAASTRPGQQPSSTVDHPSSGSAPAALPAATSGRPYWILQDFDVQALVSGGIPSALLSVLFDNPRTLLIVKPGFASADALLPAASRVADYASLTKLRQDLASGSVPAGTSYLMFDDEHWAATPAAEQADPISSAEQAEQLAHAHGYHFIFTPAADLSPVLSSTYDNRTKYDGYLALQLAAQGARVSDIFEIQAQQDEGGGYAAFVQAAVAQAHAASPQTLVMVGLTSRAPGVSVTAQSLVGDYQSVRPLVSGYWLNLPGGHGGGPAGVPSAVGFLKGLEPVLGVTP